MRDARRAVAGRGSRGLHGVAIVPVVEAPRAHLGGQRWPWVMGGQAEGGRPAANNPPCAFDCRLLGVYQATIPQLMCYYVRGQRIEAFN